MEARNWIPKPGTVGAPSRLSNFQFAVADYVLCENLSGFCGKDIMLTWSREVDIIRRPRGKEPVPSLPRTARPGRSQSNALGLWSARPPLPKCPTEEGWIPVLAEGEAVGTWPANFAGKPGHSPAPDLEAVGGVCYSFPAIAGRSSNSARAL